MKRHAYSYYGGKHGLAETIIDLMADHEHYVEAFAGSFVVGLNKPMSKIETLNDLNSDICNFFKVLRDRPEALINALQFTPYSRSEFEQAWLPQLSDDVEMARRFFVKISMDVSKAGRRQDKSWSKNVKYTHNAFSYAPNNFYTKVNGLQEVSERIRNIQVENTDALGLIKKMDSKSTLFYLDPPYVPSTRKSRNDYLFEYSTQSHKDLANVLGGIKGRFILSGYNSELYDMLYKDYFKVQMQPKQVPMSKGNGRITTEVIWLNYDPTLEVKKQLSLF